MAPPPTAPPTRSRPALIAMLQNGRIEPGKLGFGSYIADVLVERGWHADEFRIEARGGDTDPGALAAHAAELAALRPDVIFAQGSTSVLALRDVVKGAIPIVFGFTADPVTVGIVEELARPSGNVTGFGFRTSDSGVKAFEVLKELIPRMTAVGVLATQLPGAMNGAKAVTEFASTVGVRARTFVIKVRSDVPAAYHAAKAEGAAALVDLASPLSHPSAEVPLQALIELTRLPTGHFQRAPVDGGGLLSYGADPKQSLRGAAGYVDRILRGAKVVDLPVQLPSSFELVINLRTAAAIGIEIPDALVGRAQAVIR